LDTTYRIAIQTSQKFPGSSASRGSESNDVSVKVTTQVPP
jgi:hypothetical protein